MKLKNCTYEQVRTAINKKLLTKKIIHLKGVKGGNRQLHIVINHKFYSWKPPLKKEHLSKTLTLKEKDNEAWIYRDDAMGNFCRYSINTETIV